MKTIKYLLSYCLILFVLFGCTNDSDNLDFLKTAAAPSNVSALFQVTQDNTGLVSITPNGDGAVSMKYILEKQVLMLPLLGILEKL